MIGDGWWATGITVAWTYSGSGEYGWSASVDYLDAGFCDDDASLARVSTEGTLRTRYAVRNISDSESALAVVIDVIKADAERLGITWREPHLYYKVDGESDDYPPPDGWRELMGEQADRLGWQRIYGSATSLAEDWQRQADSFWTAEADREAGT